MGEAPRLYAGHLIDVDGRPVVVHSVSSWGASGGPRPGSQITLGTCVSGLDAHGRTVIARWTVDGWADTDPTWIVRAPEAA